MLEHGAYTLLIHSCYDRERFPTLNEAFDWCWARTQEEKNAVEFVLSKFFDLVDDVYVQNRIKDELVHYHEIAQNNKRIATEREDKRKNKSRNVHESCKSVNEPPPNQEPRTKNHKPKEPKNISVIHANIFPDVADRQLISDWVDLRKSKKAPITKTAVQGIEREAKIAGLSLEAVLRICCERGWAGFKAEWIQQEIRGKPGRGNPNLGMSEDARRDSYQKIFGVPMPEGKVIDHEA